MFRGSYTARIDENGRFKLPVAYKRTSEEKFGRKFFLTVPEEGVAKLYPFETWVGIENRAKVEGREDDDYYEILKKANFFGVELEMDSQGRLVVPPNLRVRARLSGDLAVTGMIGYMEIANYESCLQQAEGSPFTAEQSRKSKRILGWS
jgi:MraZ protein